ncbi:MAG: DUF4331 domain-containing protein [Halomonadaceae bacterium]|nr:MAG: DUF4331 domain-containing protein [Halomonadaceae bacterium]
MKSTFQRAALATAVAGLCLSTAMVQASSHREAPFITERPKVDGTDFYMFRSYEDGRMGGESDNGYVTMIANYLPLQSPFGGPNYFDLDENAIYEIHIDWSANGQENLTFQFNFSDVNQDLQLDIGGTMVSVPLKNIGEIGPGATDGEGSIATRQEYTLRVIQGDRRTGSATTLTNKSTGENTFKKPLDNIGNKSIPEYAAYADTFIHTFDMPSNVCSGEGKVFVGQRREAFAIALGEIFDLANLTDPLGDRDAGRNDLANKNVTSLAVEVPTDCLTRTDSETAGGDPVIGGWTTASIRQVEIINPEPTDKNFSEDPMGQAASVRGGAFTQVSRVGMPLTNEVVIGLKDKDRFNHSQPRNDGQFAAYATNPTLPNLLNIVLDGAVMVPEIYPRDDLVEIFLTGLTLFDENDEILFDSKPVGVQASEMLRLNTAVAPTPFDEQSDLGLLELDAAGFPNGRRPKDDVVDIALRAVVGGVLPFLRDENGDPFVDPNNGAPVTDGAVVTDDLLLDDHRFPYLGHPLAGSPFPNGGE